MPDGDYGEFLYYRRRHSSPERSHVAQALSCLERGDRLTRWERSFLTSLVRFSNLTRPQLDKLNEIRGKVIIAGSAGPRSRRSPARGRRAGR